VRLAGSGAPFIHRPQAGAKSCRQQRPAARCTSHIVGITALPCWPPPNTIPFVDTSAFIGSFYRQRLYFSNHGTMRKRSELTLTDRAVDWVAWSTHRCDADTGRKLAQWCVNRGRNDVARQTQTAAESLDEFFAQAIGSSARLESLMSRVMIAGTETQSAFNA